MAKRKQVFAYNKDYLKLGFAAVEVNDEVRPQCVVCFKVLAHSSLKEGKLCRHLDSNHKKFVDKTLEVFKEKEHHEKRSRIDRPATWRRIAYSHNKAVRASFSVVLKIARAKTPHTARENLVKRAAVEIARIMCCNAVAIKLAVVSLSNHTIKQPIQELPDDILQQTIASVQHSGKFCLQLGETTDIGNNAQFMVFV